MTGEPVRRLEYAELRDESERFLAEYWSDRELPVPIEEIIECDLRMEIFPIEGLQRSEGIDGCLSADQMTIHIDAFVQRESLNRYRFSLAHELSHRILHGYLYEALRFDSVTEWKRVVQAIPEWQRRRFEWQANALAGIILVPTAELHSQFADAMAMLAGNGMTLSDDPDAVKEAISEYLGRRHFSVSATVVRIRLDNEGLWKPE